MTLESPFQPGYYTERELRSLGFRSIGDDVRIARNCTIVGLENISIGSRTRIDGYTTISAHGSSGSFVVGANVHIGGYGLFIAGEGIEIGDFANLSQGVRIYSRSDDYSGLSMTNPTVPERFKRIESGPVWIGQHVIVGSGSTILPGVRMGDGVAVGAMSLVKSSLDEWGIYAGIPAVRIKSRSRDLLDSAALYLEGLSACP